MTTSPTDSDSPAAASQSPTRQAAECEAGLRRVLAYICAQRHRRLIVFTGVFLLIYSVAGFPVSLVSPVVTGLLLEYIYHKDIPIGPEMYPLIFSLTRITPSLLITALIFVRLKSTYQNYVPHG